MRWPRPLIGSHLQKVDTNLARPFAITCKRWTRTFSSVRTYIKNTFKYDLPTSGVRPFTSRTHPSGSKVRQVRPLHRLPPVRPNHVQFCVRRHSLAVVCTKWTRDLIARTWR